MIRKNGGPAFPVQRDQQFPATSEAGSPKSGMSLLDWFAGNALQGYLASCGPHTEPSEVASTIAEDCYKIANAMLAEREKYNY